MASPSAAGRRPPADERTRKLFEKWRGGDAAMWDYTVSHKTLRIRVSLKGLSQALLVICGDCDYLSGVTKWSNCSLEVERQIEGGEVSYILRDERNDFTVRCGLVGAKEIPYPPPRRERASP